MTIFTLKRITNTSMNPHNIACYAYAWRSVENDRQVDKKISKETEKMSKTL